jgi:hypothetical protein
MASKMVCVAEKSLLAAHSGFENLIASASFLVFLYFITVGRWGCKRRIKTR